MTNTLAAYLASQPAHTLSEEPARFYVAQLTLALGALTEAQAICERNEVSEMASSVAALRRCAVAAPAAACGVLVWTRRNLCSRQFSGARFNAPEAQLTRDLGTSRAAVAADSPWAQYSKSKAGMVLLARGLARGLPTLLPPVLPQ